jgi:hypothetical protein
VKFFTISETRAKINRIIAQNYPRLFRVDSPQGNPVLWARSYFNGLAAKDEERFENTAAPEIPNRKSQISNKPQWPKFEIPNVFSVSVIEYWKLRFVCNLVLGVWDFIDSSTPWLQRTLRLRRDPKRPPLG